MSEQQATTFNQQLHEREQQLEAVTAELADLQESCSRGLRVQACLDQHQAEKESHLTEWGNNMLNEAAKNRNEAVKLKTENIKLRRMLGLSDEDEVNSNRYETADAAASYHALSNPLWAENDEDCLPEMGMNEDDAWAYGACSAATGFAATPCKADCGAGMLSWLPDVTSSEGTASPLSASAAEEFAATPCEAQVTADMLRDATPMASFRSSAPAADTCSMIPSTGCLSFSGEEAVSMVFMQPLFCDEVADAATSQQTAASSSSATEVSSCGMIFNPAFLSSSGEEAVSMGLLILPARKQSVDMLSACIDTTNASRWQPLC
jgi:hypothetical protein